MADTPNRSQPGAGGATDLTGSSVGRFAILARLGAGGMGEVYRAEDTLLKRPVALKRIRPDLRADPRSRERLEKEAECASQLTNPHVAAVYDVLEEGQELFLVMEYVEGQTLRRRISQPLPVAEFLEIATQCAAAVAAAHQSGVFHRDLKPENIMLTPAGQVKVLDFGVARNIPGDDAGTTLGTMSGTAGLSGTVAYMAPEVLEEKGADARADIFSLGVVFYEALAGKNPFLAEGFLPTCERILREEPAPLRQANPQAPAELERIVTKMLAKNPAQRYATAADLVVDLEALRRPQGPLLRGPEAPPVPAPGAKRRALLAAALAAALCLVIVIAYAYRRAHSVVLAEHATLLVTDFDNQTNEKLFDQTVTEAVRQALAQSRYVRIVPRSQVLEAARMLGRADVTHVDAALGREICQRENYRAMIVGRIAPAGSGYEITVEMVDPSEGTSVLTETAALNSPADLYPAVDGLTKRLREHVGESLAQVARNSAPLAQVTTSSIEALQRYSRALDYYAAGDLENFMPLAKSAVALDPDFAMGHLYLALALERMGNEKEARQHMVSAEAGASRVTERERHLILALDYRFDGLDEKAAEQYRLLSEIYPQDAEAYEGLAQASYEAGRSEDAIAAVRRALQLNPHSAVDYQVLVLYLNRVNRFSEALEAYHSAQVLGIKSPQLRRGAGLAYLGEDNPQAARHELEMLRSEGGPYEDNLAALYLARVLMYEGRLKEAADGLQAGIVLDEKLHSDTWVPVRRYLLAEVQRTRGRSAEARAEAHRLAEDARTSPGPENLRRAGLAAVELGDVATARDMLGKLEDLASQQESGFTKSCYENLKGALSLASGQTAAALESQKRAAVFAPSFEASLALAETYEAGRQWSDAIAAYQQYLGFKGEVFDEDSPAQWVLANLALARAMARSGDSRQAIHYYDEFLKRWANGDADLVILQEARSERAKLGAAQAASAVEKK
jgi:serine/threonine-protein kinase